MLRRMRVADRCARVIVLGAWMGLITWWSGQGNLPIDQPAVADLFHGFQHRFAHLLAFGLVGLLARWAFDGLPRAAWIAVLLTSFFGISDEWHQSFTPGRRPAIDDWAVDTASAALALYLWSRLRGKRWQHVRTLAPLAVTAMFVVGVGLAVRPGLGVRSNLNRSTLHSITTQAASRALGFARSTRAVAHQIRSSVTG